jgi:sugar-specific transcriptional regulator TrmB
MEQEVLQNLGFTQAEAKVYLTLLKLGSVKVGKVIETSGLQSSTIHNTLNSLVEDGYINYVLKGKIKIYSAVSPKILLTSFKEREEKLKEILPMLTSIHKSSEEKITAEVYEGIKGVITMFNELIEDSKPGENYYFFSADVPEHNEEIQEFFKIYDLKRESRRLIIKGIARKELKPLFIKRKSHKMKYVNFPIPTNIGICEDKISFINWGEKPSGVLIKSKQIVDAQINFFNELWKKS